MDNQYTKAAGYRHLSPEELDLMVRIKAKAAELLTLQAELVGRLDTDAEVKLANARRSIEGHEYEGRPYNVYNGNTDECREYRRFEEAEPLRWAAIGKTDIQTGIMALMRAVAQPTVC
ncbi:hypothetical protein [Acinetobacter baumannii]|uniref:Acb2/Tad1 domain-containing protein n=1 Tax=Acinetobacter baumannii TaxID=470 RepID=UPI003A8B61B0